MKLVRYKVKALWVSSRAEEISLRFFLYIRDDEKGFILGAKRKNFYAVARGRVPGIYRSWEEAEKQVKGFSRAKYEGFVSLKEAKAFLEEAAAAKEDPDDFEEEPPIPSSEEEILLHTPDEILIFSDGCALGNPGPGGYGVIVIHENGEREELSQGFSLTTNNRMELLGAIAGLRFVRNKAAEVLISSDSSYLVNGMEKGWAKGWKRRGWKKADGKPALNTDLWSELLDLAAEKKVSFLWIRGHAGHPENERCDVLAKNAAGGKDLPPDTGYAPVQIQAEVEVQTPVRARETLNLPGFD